MLESIDQLDKWLLEWEAYLAEEERVAILAFLVEVESILSD